VQSVQGTCQAEAKKRERGEEYHQQSFLRGRRQQPATGRSVTWGSGKGGAVHQGENRNAWPLVQAAHSWKNGS